MDAYTAAKENQLIQGHCFTTFTRSDDLSKFRSRHRKCFIKKLFLKISRYSQENTCVGTIITRTIIKAGIAFKKILL